MATVGVRVKSDGSENNETTRVRPKGSRQIVVTRFVSTLFIIKYKRFIYFLFTYFSL